MRQGVPERRTAQETEAARQGLVADIDAPRGTWRDEAYGTWMLARRETARYLNVWGQTVVPAVVSAALFLFVFGHALGDRIREFDGVPYLTFILPGLVIQGAITNAYANTGSSLFDARRAGYIDDVLSSPVRDWQIVLAYAISGVSRGVLIGAATLLIAIPVADGWDVALVPFLLVLLLSCLAFSMLGLLVGLWASRWDHIFVPQTFVMTPLIFLGGVFYPVELLSAPLAFASRLNPIYHIVEAQRAALLGGDVSWTAIAGMALACWLLYFWVLRAFQTSPRLRG